MLRNLKLYQTKARFYLVGRSLDKRTYRVAKFSRLEDQDLQASDDPVTYSDAQRRTLLNSIHDGNKAHGGLTLVLEADALIGCFRFLEGFYLLFVSQKKLVGSMCGTHKIYTVGDISLVSLRNPERNPAAQESKDERRYRKVLSCVELTKNFFFSYSWPLWRTLQANISRKGPDAAWDSMFVWNNYLTRPLRSLIDPDLWVMPLIHGHWQQRTLAILSQTVTITLIARRSKHFAGTRYRKRGINDQGHVANDVETEQVVCAGFDWRSGYPIVSSIVQMRGSIPLFWIQDYHQRKLKPDILLQRFDPLYEATRLHFEDLSNRYGNPVVVLNLVKSVEKRPREQLLRAEFGNAVNHINQQRPESGKIVYIPWDFNLHAKQRGSQILTLIEPVIQQSLQLTSMFVCAPGTSDAIDPGAGSNPQPKAKMVFQRGVLRTNCIDCLDRTNVAQFALGLYALGEQLHALGVSETPLLDPRSGVAVELMNQYEQMGNVLARQYGGSEAHSTIFRRQRGDWEYKTALGDKLTTLRRYYSNTYTDAEKQDALNVFLGNFVPAPGRPAIWELDSDYYLHSGLGQRFLRHMLARAESATSGVQSSSGSAVVPPGTIAGHADGEGVRDVSALLAEAAEGSRQRSSTLTSPEDGRSRTGDQPDRRGSKVPKAARSQDSLGGVSSLSEESTARPEPTDIPEGAASHAKELSLDDSSTAAEGPNPFSAQLDSEDGDAFPRELKESRSAPLQSARDSARKSRAPRLVSRGSAPPLAEPGRLPNVADDLVLRGLCGWRGNAAGAKRAKLESFDRKLGRANNAVVEANLDALASTSSTFLPHWLASPLGISRSRAISMDLSAHGAQEAARVLSIRTSSLDNPHIGTVQERVSAPPRTALERHSADSGPVRPRSRSSTTLPITRSASVMNSKWGQSVSDEIRDALSESIVQSPFVTVASPPAHYPPFASNNEHDIGRQFLSKADDGSLGLPSSKELVESILSRSLATLWTDESAGEMLRKSKLWLTPAMQAWWAGGEGPWEAWHEEEAAAHAAYTRYLGKAEQLNNIGEEESELTSSYRRLCACPPVSATLIDPVQDPKKFKRAGIVDMNAWGEAAIARLAQDHANTM